MRFKHSVTQLFDNNGIIFQLYKQCFAVTSNVVSINFSSLHVFVRIWCNIANYFEHTLDLKEIPHLLV